MFPPAFAPGLSLLGLPFKVVPFPQHELQAKLVARVLSGKAVLPSREEMEQHTAASDTSMMARGVPLRHYHMQGESQWDYNNGIAALCGPDVAKTPAWRIKMYSESGVWGRNYQNCTCCLRDAAFLFNDAALPRLFDLFS